MPVAVAGGGIAIGDLLVMFCIVVLAVILWSLIQVRGPMGNVPVVGGTGVSLIDGLSKAVGQVGLTLEGWLTATQQAAGNLWGAFIHQAIDVPLAGLQNTIVGIGDGLKSLVNATIPAIQAAVADVQQLLATQVLPRITALESSVVADEHYVQGVLAVDLAQLTTAVQADERQLASAITRLAETEAAVVAQAQALAVIAGYLPLLRTLAAFEAGTSGGLSVVEQEIANVRGRVVGAEADITRLLSLLGLAAIGAVAIENLIRIAKNPCGICEGLDLSGVEGRLSSLEFFGES